MDKFIVSARKYRPQNFSTVVGQEHITTTLKNAISHNQLAHAFLFCGPRGVGKTTCARILAKTINCTNKTVDTEACNICNSCKSFDNGTSMNIHELDAASNNSVDDIRTLTEQVRFAPQAGDYKVYIVDEVHMLSSSAFNAFLKTLEEPPPFAIFILATTEKHKILPTILSRCQIFDFKRITTADTVKHLQEIASKESITAEPAALHVIAQKSEGCLRDALSILDKIVSFTNGKITYTNTLEHLNILDEDYYFKLMEHLQRQELAEAMLLFDEVLQKGFESDTFLEGMMEFIRNLLMSTDPKVANLLDVADEFKLKYKEVAQQVPANWMIAALHLLSDNAIAYKQAKNKKLHVELCLIKLTYLQQAITVTAADTGVVKKKSLDAVKSLAFRNIALIAIPKIKTADKKEKVYKVSAIQNEEASLHIEEPRLTLKQEITDKPTADPARKLTPNLASLKKLQKEVANTFHVEMPVIAVTKEGVDAMMVQLCKKLRAQGKDSTVAQLCSVEIEVIDETNFVFYTHNTLHAKFILAERAALADTIQEYFHNPAIKYEIITKEQNDNEIDNNQVPVVSKREQYFNMVQKNPIIQELKDKLRLTID